LIEKSKRLGVTLSVLAITQLGSGTYLINETSTIGLGKPFQPFVCPRADYLVLSPPEINLGAYEVRFTNRGDRGSLLSPTLPTLLRRRHSCISGCFWSQPRDQE